MVLQYNCYSYVLIDLFIYNFLSVAYKMSWFSELAGKAEDLLNKMDQGAATALTKTQERSYGEEIAIQADIYKAHSSAEPSHPESKSSFISAAAGNIKKSNPTLMAGTSNTNAFSSDAHTSTKVSSGFVRPKKEQDVDDDLLFDFLNSADPPTSNRRDSRRDLIKMAVPVAESKTPTPPPLSNTQNSVPSAPSTPPSTRGVSRASSMSSLSALSVKTSEDNSAKEQSQGTNRRFLFFLFVLHRLLKDYVFVGVISLISYQMHLLLSMCRVR